MTSSLPIYTKSEEFFWEQIIFSPYINYSTNDPINDPISDLRLEIMKNFKTKSWNKHGKTDRSNLRNYAIC